MPRLPDLDSLGQRPVPFSRRPVASNPRAGAVAEAVSGLGDQLVGTGQKMFEKEDKLAYAAAKTAVLRADIAARQELETDPDYETWETKYAERMRGAREAAGKLIRSRSDRTLFEADAELDIARGGAALASTANVRRRDARVALLDEGLTAAEEAAASATDDATREAAINSASELIRGAVEHGDITAEEGGRRGRQLGERHITQRAETLLMADDFEGALALIELNQGRLSAATEMSLRRQIDDGMDNRNALSRAEEAVHGAVAPSAPEGEAPNSFQVAGPAAPVAGELQRAGYSNAVVAGFLGNFEVEGGYGGARGDGGTASGIAQWRNERRANFRRKFGKEPHEATAAEQAQFVVWEMENPRAAGMTVAQRDAILAADTPEEAAALIDQHYERSSGAHRERRVQAARDYHGGTTQGPQKHNLDDVYARIDARAVEEKWTPEETEAAKAQAARLVDRDEGLLSRQYREAEDEAAQIIAGLPQGLANINQIPKPIRDRMDPTDVAVLQQGIRERAQEAAEDRREAARDQRAAELEYMKRFLPNEYARLSPLQEANRLNPEQYNTFLMDWTEARQGKPPKQSEIEAGIRNEVAYQERNGVALDEEQKVRLYVGMEAQLGLIRERKGFITAADYGEVYRSMLKQLPGTGGLFSSDRRVFEALEVPPAEADRIRRAWTGSTPPSDAQILQTWMELRR